MWKKIWKEGSSLQKRLYMLMLVCLVPLTLLIIYFLVVSYRFSERYDTITERIMIANEYNLSFKEDIDYSMYIIVVNMERADELIDTGYPYELIASARNDFTTLYRLAGTEYARNQLDGILRCLNTLEDRIDEIEADVLVSGSYDKNMERLDLNVRVMTELVQEQIQAYIYYETTRLDSLQQELRADVMSALRVSIIVFLMILAGAILISRQIVKSIMVPIRRLSETAKQASSGDFAVRVEESGDELAVLNTSFNQMIEQIGVLVEDIRLEQINLRQTELKVLQAQINPHFLYNTLDGIIWLMEAGKKDEAVQMVSLLSDFFRTSLSKGRDYITVREEEAHISSYLQIQQFRYKDILSYDIRIARELHSFSILKLTLQPLVENALYHGIKNKREGGHILVNGYSRDDCMIFEVRDDGIGMTPERLAYVQEQILVGADDQSGSTSGFGLFNVNQRLQFNYGSEYGLTLQSTYGQGTTVTVTIPIVKK